MMTVGPAVFLETGLVVGAHLPPTDHRDRGAVDQNRWVRKVV
jgi:hypothetical protein